MSTVWGMSPALAELVLKPANWIRLPDEAYNHRDEILAWPLAYYALPAYVILVLIGKGLMSFVAKPFPVKKLVALHNLFLCLWSLAMVIGTIHSVVTSGFSLNGVYCNTDGALLKGRLWFWCALFYISKYYELLDTLFILLLKRPLLVLHVWHHTSIAVLCLVFMRSGYAFFWSGVAINAGIHTFMYWYYFRSALGSAPKWAKLMTTGQIVQFVWGISSFWGFFYFCKDSDRTEPAMQAWWLNQGILISYLALFLRFFFGKYTEGDKAAKKDKPKKN